MVSLLEVVQPKKRVIWLDALPEEHKAELLTLCQDSADHQCDALAELQSVLLGWYGALGIEDAEEEHCVYELTADLEACFLQSQQELTNTIATIGQRFGCLIEATKDHPLQRRPEGPVISTDPPITRKVAKSGHISYQAHTYFVSKALAGQHIQLRIAHGCLIIQATLTLHKTLPLHHETPWNEKERHTS